MPLPWSTDGRPPPRGSSRAPFVLRSLRGSRTAAPVASRRRAVGQARAHRGVHGADGDSAQRRVLALQGAARVGRRGRRFRRSAGGEHPRGADAATGRPGGAHPRSAARRRPLRDGSEGLARLHRLVVPDRARPFTSVQNPQGEAMNLRSLLLSLAVAGAASATPVVTVTPPSGARFFPGQRFDIRVEAKGTGPYAAELSVDGRKLSFTSPSDASTPSASTDSVTSPGYGGFNLRGFSSRKPGLHTIIATVSDGTGPVATASASFLVVSPGGGDDSEGTRNIIILLGDGMGTAHRTAARIVRFGVTGGDPNGYLAMDGFPGTGLVSTHSLNSIVTDSAPGMACYTTGNHAQNGQEGVYPAHMTNPFYYPRVEYMAEYLHRVKGTSTGIVSTADVEDATPAANAVHTGNRNAGQGIVDQYLDEGGNTGLAVLMGGGRRWFLPKGQHGSTRAAGNDYGPLPEDLQAAWNAPAGAIDESRDLLADFRKAGFSYVSTAAELGGLGTPEKLIGLFAYGNMNVALDKIAKRRDPSRHGVVDDYHAPDQPMLDEMAAAALRVLSRNKRGFFLMVEGAHIDKQSHLMDAERTVGEVIEFDRAVGVARRWADKLGNTIVIVVSDHECSGFSIIGALKGTVAPLASERSDADDLQPDPTLAKQPARLARVGTYDSAAFPKYDL